MTLQRNSLFNISVDLVNLIKNKDKPLYNPNFHIIRNFVKDYIEYNIGPDMNIFFKFLSIINDLTFDYRGPEFSLYYSIKKYCFPSR